MRKFDKDLANFLGKRVESIGSSLYVRIQEKYSSLSGSGKDEDTYGTKCEAAYLKGLIDGIRLTKMV